MTDDTPAFRSERLAAMEAKIQVKITAKNIDVNEVKSKLEESAGREVAFQIREPEDRAIETAVLIALIGVASTGLKTLLGGLLQFGREKLASKIIVQTEKARIEVPVGLPLDQLDNLIDRVKRLETSEVSIHLA